MNPTELETAGGSRRYLRRNGHLRLGRRREGRNSEASRLPLRLPHEVVLRGNSTHTTAAASSQVLTSGAVAAVRSRPLLERRQPQLIGEPPRQRLRI